MEYPVTTELPFDGESYREALGDFYAACTARLAALAGAGEDVVVLCEGDPFFYGSFMHLHARLRVPVEVVPGITGMSGAWTATGLPVTWGDDVLTVLAGTLPEAELRRRIADTDAVVVMKLGRNLDKVRRALAARGGLSGVARRMRDHAGRSAWRASPRRSGPAPYFSIVVVHGQGRRP